MNVNNEAKTKDRIRHIISHLGLTISSFSEKIGSQQSTISRALSDKGVFGEGLANKVSMTFGINKDWILEGKGEMLKSDKQNNIYEVSPVAEEDYMMVEYEDLQASAGYIGTGDVAQLSDKKKRLVPREYKNGKFLVVRVDGDSMDDNSKRSLSNGDEILIYLNEDLKINQLPIRKTLFVITTYNGNVVKQIAEINNDEQYIVCRSFNSSYEDYKIKFEDILQIFTVCKVVSRQISF